MRKASVKTAFNVACARNIFHLDWRDRRYIVHKANLSFCIPTASITQYARRKRSKNYNNWNKYDLVNFHEVYGEPLQNHKTFRFIKHIIEGNDYRDTEFFKCVSEGRLFGRRRFSDDPGELKSRITAQDFSKYYTRCLALIDSIRRHGVLDVEFGMESEAIRIRNTHMNEQASTIGLAIDSEGRPLHFTKGHHRMAIAQLLRIEIIPIQIHYLSGQYLRKFVSKADLFSEQKLFGAIRRAVDASMRKWCGV